MRMTTRSPPIMSHPFTFPDFDNTFFDGTFASPPPAPASGPSLLDDQETSAFADFLDKVGSGQDASLFFESKMPLFDPKIPDPMMWGWHEETTSGYPLQPSGLSAATPPTNIVTTPLSSERTTSYTVKQETRDERKGSVSIVPTEIALDPFAALQPSPRPVATDRSHPQIQGLQWGSDPNFKFGGFSTSATKDQVHVAKENMLVERAMAMLVKGGDSSNTTAANTAVNSPTENRVYPGIQEGEEEQLVSPSKRRKSFHRKTSEEEEDDDDESSSSSPQPRAKSKSAKADLTSPSAKQKKKKKPKGPKRENLTEAQKRENHIQSEQKRRNLIREGFDDICTLVPELRGGGYSKSAILIHAANFLEQLEEGNKALQLRVKQLGGTA
ncbi:hypothetical protein ABW19_dt0200650 [Dactylella cylindrospora]|nr:hypothetical protein ABW19_dt0200650 [Dactylella cylindrospora]